MTAKEYKKAKILAKIRNIIGFVADSTSATLLILLIVLTFNSCIMGKADARPAYIYQPAQPTIVHHESKNYDAIGYVMVGVIVGIILYDITTTKCDNGIICTKF